MLRLAQARRNRHAGGTEGRHSPLSNGRAKPIAPTVVAHFDLFERVQVDAGLLGDGEKRVMATTRGAVNARSFTSLVKQAVEGKWVENGRMRHADR